MAISPIPLFSGTPPNRQQSQNDFNTNVANWVTYTTTIQTDFNTFGTQANALAVEVEGYKDLSFTYKNDAAASAAAALSSQNLAAASADFKGEWASLSGALNKPSSVFHNGSYWALLNNLANVALSEPSPTNADWQFISGTFWQPLKTSSFNAVMNAAYDVLATSSPVSVALQSGVDGNFVIVRNSFDSTQAVTITNAIWTIKCVSGITINIGDTITLRAGEFLRFKARSGTILEQY